MPVCYFAQTALLVGVCFYEYSLDTRSISITNSILGTTNIKIRSPPWVTLLCRVNSQHSTFNRTIWDFTRRRACFHELRFSTCRPGLRLLFCGSEPSPFKFRDAVRQIEFPRRYRQCHKTVVFVLVSMIGASVARTQGLARDEPRLCPSFRNRSPLLECLHRNTNTALVVFFLMFL